MNTISQTGVATKTSGDSLTSAEVNAINNTVNSCVTAANYLLTSFCNINLEVGNMTAVYTLAEAAATVPISRRELGLKLRYLAATGMFVDYVYSGPSTSTTDWIETSNWYIAVEYLDGGEW